MSEDNKARVRKYFEETLSKGNMTYVDEIADGAMAESLKRGATGLRSAFADMHDQVQDQMTDGKKVVTRFAGGGHLSRRIYGCRADGKNRDLDGHFHRSFCGWKNRGAVDRDQCTGRPAADRRSDAAMMDKSIQR